MGIGEDLIRRFGLHYIIPSSNLASVLENGLLSRNEMLARRIHFDDISDHEVQVHRERHDPVHGRPIHDYVPLYLNHRNAMLYRRKEIQDRLVILIIDREVTSRPGVLFCDGNAASAATSFSIDPDILGPSRAALEADYWKNVPDGTRRRMAEVLIPDEIPRDAIARAVCNNQGLVTQIRREHDLYASVDASKFFENR